jgi:hypothetical protein
MSSIAKSINLKEITIENNPISLAGDCVSFLVSYLPLLNSLNQLQITEQGKLRMKLRVDIYSDLGKAEQKENVRAEALKAFRQQKKSMIV